MAFNILKTAHRIGKLLNVKTVLNSTQKVLTVGQPLLNKKE